MSDEVEISEAPTQSHRYFRAAAEIYDGARAHFISVFRQPRNGTVEPFPAYDDPRTPKDSEGRALVALLLRECAWSEVGQLIQDLIDAEQIEEITYEQYLAALPQPES